MSGSEALARLARPERLPLRCRVALAAEIGALYAHARWVLRRHDIRMALELLRAPAVPGRSSPAEAYAAGVRLARAVARVLGRLPGDTRCLTMSAVLCALLARRGVGASLVIGVRQGSKFGAHAWVELDGHRLMPPPNDDFARLVAL